MIEEIKYKDVEIVVPDFIEYFGILSKSEDKDAECMWCWLGTSKDELKPNLDYQRKTDIDCNVQRRYKIISLMLPS